MALADDSILADQWRPSISKPNFVITSCTSCRDEQKSQSNHEFQIVIIRLKV